MSSKTSADRVDFARDVTTTAADVEALRVARTAAQTIGDYLEFLESFPVLPTLALRRRRGPRGEPFRMLGPPETKRRG